MGLSEAITNKVKALLFEDKIFEAEVVLTTEAGLSEEESRDYIAQLQGSKSKPKESKGLGIIFTVLGLLIISVAVYLAILKKEALSNSVLVSGVVVGFSFDDTDDVWQDSQFDDDITYAPIIVYEVGGKQYKKTSTLSSSPPAYALNEKISLYVNKDNPYDIILDSFIDKWIVALSIGGFGFLFSFIGILVVVLKPAKNDSGFDMFDDDERMSDMNDFD